MFRTLFIIFALIIFTISNQPVCKASESAALNYVEDTSAIPEGFVAVLYGILDDVRVMSEGKGDWHKIDKPVSLKLQSEIQTAKGKSKIRLENKGQVRLPPFSHMKLEKNKNEAISLILKKGKVWNSIVSQPDKDYIVRTPDLTAGVRGALFAMQTDEKEGTRVSVFDGELGIIPKGGTENDLIILKKGQQVVINKAAVAGKIGAVNQQELEEWDEWDEWALEVHEEIGSKFVFGGDAISNLAKLAAMDNQKAERINQQAAADIAWNREGDHVDAIAKAFLDFYKHTGHKPTEEEGFSVLIENTQNWPEWQGPYLTGPDASGAPKDRWGKPIQYKLTRTPGGKEIFIVVSNGPDKRYSRGKADDVMSYVFYSRVQR